MHGAELEMTTTTVRPPSSVAAGRVPSARDVGTFAFASLSQRRPLSAFTPPGTHSTKRLRRNTSRRFQSQKKLLRLREQLAPLRRSDSASEATNRHRQTQRGRLPASPIRLSGSAGDKRRAKVKALSEPATPVPASPATLLVATGGGNTLRVWRVGAAPEIKRIGQAPGEVLGIDVASDGLQAVIRRTNGRVQLVSTAGDHVSVQDANGPGMGACAFSVSGRVAAAYTDDSVRVYRASTGARVGVLRGHKAAVVDVVYSPDGLTLASASADGTVRLRNPALLGATGSGSCHQQAVEHLAVTPFEDNAQLVSVDAAGQCKVRPHVAEVMGVKLT